MDGGDGQLCHKPVALWVISRWDYHGFGFWSSGSWPAGSRHLRLPRLESAACSSGLREAEP